MTLRRVPVVLVAFTLLFAAATLARRASAGALHVRDEAHVLSPDDVAKLRSVVAAAPFDGRLAVTNEYADAQDLSRYAGSLVAEPNVVAIALDPQHHHVQVHFGTGSRVARADWPAIERAGNEAFRRGDWEGGAAAILRDAAHAAATGAPAEAARSVDGTSDGARPSLFGPGLLLLIVAGVIALAIYFAWKRSTYATPRPQGFGGGPYGGTGYPGAPPQGGMGPLGGGLIGAGLGGIAGYELGKLEGEREGYGREREGARGDMADDRGAGDFDAGGGGSGWDDDGGGGGFDGGGGDAGGGGSDFGA